jgi:TPR repeat protein
MHGEAALAACLAAAKVAREDPRTLYQLGRALRKNGSFENARAAFQLADSLGSLRASLELGAMHELGQGAGRDLDAARRLYEKSAAGLHLAKLQLGALYWNGLGVAQDVLRASRLHDEAVKAELEQNPGITRPHAHFLAGWLYHWGEPIRDYVEARRWFEWAAHSGSPVAMRHLGIIHAEGGYGLTRDRAAAESWFKAAIQAGDTDSYGYLAMLR